MVTAAVLAYNRREAVAVTLTKLLGSLEHPAHRLEVVVVDNASTDGTAEMVRSRFLEATLVRSPSNEGIGGWNRAFAVASGDWLLVLDDDCYVEGDALRRALDAAREQGADMVSFRVESSETELAFSDAYRTGLLAFWGCAVLISRRAVEELGGFDGGLFIWAHELEFTMRFLDHGFRHVLLPDVAAVHMKAVGPPTVAGHNRNMHNWGYVAGKLLRPADAAVALVNLSVRSLLEGLLDRGHLKGLPAVLRGFRAGLRVREPVRPQVSRLYRRHFLEFGSFVRIAMRVRGLGDPDSRGIDFRRRFWSERPFLYPSAPAGLRVPATMPDRPKHAIRES